MIVYTEPVLRRKSSPLDEVPSASPPRRVNPGAPSREPPAFAARGTSRADDMGGMTLPDGKGRTVKPAPAPGNMSERVATFFGGMDTASRVFRGGVKIGC